jgi:acetyl esterase/lipase
VAKHVIERAAAEFADAAARAPQVYERAAGMRCTSVRYNATIHDFMMLNALRETAASNAAIRQAIDVSRQAFE